MKANPHSQCYRCQGHGYFESQCPSHARTLLVEVHKEEENEDGLELIVHQQVDNLDASAEDYEFSGSID